MVARTSRVIYSARLAAGTETSNDDAILGICRLITVLNGDGRSSVSRGLASDEISFSLPFYHLKVLYDDTVCGGSRTSLLVLTWLLMQSIRNQSYIDGRNTKLLGSPKRPTDCVSSSLW